MATAETRVQASEFVNEPFIDFSQPVNRKRMEEALKKVEGELDASTRCTSAGRR